MVYRLVEGLVGTSKVGGHQIRVVEGRQMRCGVGVAGIKHRLCGGLDGRDGSVVCASARGWCGECVVDDADGVPVVALDPPAGLSEPGHVHRRCQQPEVGERRVFHH